MKHDNEARRKSDEKRKRRKFNDEHDDAFFTGKMKKRALPRSDKNWRHDDSDWHDAEHDHLT